MEKTNPESIAALCARLREASEDADGMPKMDNEMARVRCSLLVLACAALEAAQADAAKLRKELDECQRNK